MDFPKESVEQAREIVSKYRQHSRSKIGIAYQLYNRYFYHISYGFSESIKTGNCGRFLHEIQKETDCYTMAGVVYLIAREAGLNPQIFWTQGARDYDEGSNKNEEGRNDHAFVVVETGKKEKTIIDPFMNLFGRLKFDFENNQIEVYAKQEKKIVYRDYRLITRLSESEYLERLRKNRTPQGGRDTLSSTQKVSAPGGYLVFLTYFPKTNEIQSSLRSDIAKFNSDPFEGAHIFDLVSKVDSDGNFSFEDGRISAYSASASGWTEHTNPHTSFVFFLRDAKQLFDLWDEFIKEKGRKAPILRASSFKLADILKRGGFEDDFSLQANSLAEKIAKKHWSEVQDWQSEVVRDYFLRCKEDEVSYKILLRNSHKTKLSDRRKSKKNPYGFIFSKKEHEKLIQEEFEKYAAFSREVMEKILEEHAIRAKIKKGSSYHAEREASRKLSKRTEQGRYFANMWGFHGSSFPLSFNIMADRYLFERTIDMDNSISELEKELTQDDILRGAQKIFFSLIINIWHLRDALFLRQYKRGLQKILKG
ncbi:hypothetical protein DRN73_02495 [Candidatus Pacearchaeota archaeon]|nr:MAG: hypothetical protein DRN73_02495 [Candidatus Pacearchaeota archaeon]